MISDILDNRKFRIIFALIVGIPSTILFLVVLPSGLMMGIVGLRELETAMLLMGCATILGTFGVIGVWLRIAKKLDKFSPGQLLFTQASLICGILATAILLIITIWAETFLLLGLPLFALLVGGVLFYVGT